jgi:anthranilate phosphoribosyltransferase
MDWATLIREIGRGRHAARSLSRSDALALARAMLAGEVPDLQLGAILIAFRMKGESADEIAAFVEAMHEGVRELPLPRADAAPVVIPAYNGARKLPNLTPLLALLLARSGVPVLLHGVREDPGRVTTCEVMAALGIPPALCIEDASSRLARERIAFVPVDVLAPALARMLVYRRLLGVRNTLHSAVKLLQPFAGPALRIVSVTHPDYLALMRIHFEREGGAALLLRGAEGEAVASLRRKPEFEWWSQHVQQDSGNLELPEGDSELQLPERDAAPAARWIEAALAGRERIPAPIASQAALAERAARSLRVAVGAAQPAGGKADR